MADLEQICYEITALKACQVAHEEGEVAVFFDDRAGLVKEALHRAEVTANPASERVGLPKKTGVYQI